MSELLDPEARSASRQEQPDEYMRRREFLTRTAMARGSRQGWPACCRRDDRRRGGAQAAPVKLPSPRNMPIDTFVC